MKVAFITGVTGQDGAYLSEFLLKKGLWRRIRVVEFLSKFCDNPKKPNEFAMDLELSDKFEDGLSLLCR